MKSLPAGYQAIVLGAKGAIDGFGPEKRLRDLDAARLSRTWSARLAPSPSGVFFVRQQDALGAGTESRWGRCRCTRRIARSVPGRG
jgi:hypothetical protein